MCEFVNSNRLVVGSFPSISYALSSADAANEVFDTMRNLSFSSPLATKEKGMKLFAGTSTVSASIAVYHMSHNSPCQSFA